MSQITLKLEPIWKVPVALTPLIGREQEVAAVCALLQRPELRLLTLLGTGGIGKTRLSVQVATHLREYFADGICFVALASLREPGLVIPAIAQELGLQESGGQSIFEQVKRALQSRDCLLILDNFEQVEEAAPLLTELLAASATLKMLVTSRAVLRVHGEYEYLVPPLTVPNLKHLPGMQDLSQNSAVALFLQRAQASKPAFQLTESNARAIAEICARLDGLPLAIELAAARVKLLPPQALLARLGQQFQVLTGGGQDVPARHQTLHNTIRWSYDLLDAVEQRLFRLLSIFVGGCTLEAVEAVAAGLGYDFFILDTVSSLLDQSLLLQIERGEEEPRLYMLETIREYGLQCLRDCGEAEMSQRAHAMHYLLTAEQAEPCLKGAQQTLWLARLDEEQENLRAGLTWLIQRVETELALRFCAALGWFWHLRGYWSEGRHWLEAALGLPQAERPATARARALYSAGDLAYYQDDYAVARSFLEECVALCRTLKIERELALALSSLGMVMHLQGNLAAARPLLEESEAICRRLGSAWELSHLLRKLGLIAWSQGNLEQAEAYAEEALALARVVGDKYHIATTLSNLCGIAARHGDPARGAQLAQEALTIARELGEKSLIATTLQNRGYLLALQGDPERGAPLALEGLALFRELDDKMFITISLHSLGYIAWLQGNTAQAAELYIEGLSIAREIGNKTRIGWLLIGLAGVVEAEGCDHRAARFLGAAETVFDVDVHMSVVERSGYEHLVQQVRTQLGEKAFTVALAEGRTMTPEEILAAPEPERLPEIEVPATQPAASERMAPSYPGGLTEREVEVVRLVAQGLTNAYIAEQLIISLHTVNAHVRSIYNKLEVNSRSALTRYAIEHDLL